MLEPIALLLLLAGQYDFSDVDDRNVAQDYEDVEAEVELEADAPEPSQRAAEADANFERIMSKNAYQQMPQGNVAPASIALVPQADAKVVVPLRAYGAMRDELKRAREQSGRSTGPAVVLGASEYRGEAHAHGLSLTMTLDVTLAGQGRWKTVPLVGDDVVLVSARRGGEALAISREDGYHVWVTDQTGEVRVELELLVPARGPRGSIEFDFLATRTPVTRFECRFPRAGLEPRIDAAVRSEVRTEGGSTVMVATLRPTTRVHLVGFRDLGETDGAKAKLYAESLSLLSIDEGALELFSVIRYTILYGATKDFQVLLPPGMTVLAADGEGAFRWSVDKTDRGNVLRGETAYPIRNAYEISLRLRRELAKTGAEESFDAPLPLSIGVEREHGWLGVEVPGKLKLEEEQRTEVLPIDLRQLPPEMIGSAVSPILKAYRYHSAAAKVRLGIARLPEKDPASASIDRLRAFTVVSAEGKILTDLKITLRNRLRPTLVLTVPLGTEVRSTLLDGQPVKPSKNERGQLMLPLRRSRGDERLEPFTLQVVLESRDDALGIAGGRGLSLPAVDLPVSSLAWSVYLPARNTYSALSGELGAQTLAGVGSWHQAAYRPPAPGGAAAPAAVVRDEAESAESGAMPVRINLPESGIRLEHTRYWIDADQPVRVSYRYLRSWLLAPLGLFFALLFAFAAGSALQARLRGGPRAMVLGLGAASVVLALVLVKVASAGVLVLAALAAFGVVLARTGRLSAGAARVSAWWRGLPEGWRTRERPEKRSIPRVLWKSALGFWMGVLVLAMTSAVVRFVALLSSPLGG